MYCLEGSLLWQNKIGRTLFLAKKNVIAESHFFFSQKRCSSVKVGLFAGFTIAASCARAAPGSPEGKQTFSKIAKFKLQAFPKRTNPLLNPY